MYILYFMELRVATQAYPPPQFSYTWRNVESLAVRRRHLVQLYESVPATLLSISHGDGAGQQLSTAEPRSLQHSHIHILRTKQWCHWIWQNSTIGLDVCVAYGNNPGKVEEGENPQLSNMITAHTDATLRIFFIKTNVIFPWLLQVRSVQSHTCS